MLMLMLTEVERPITLHVTRLALSSTAWEVARRCNENERQRIHVGDEGCLTALGVKLAYVGPGVVASRETSPRLAMDRAKEYAKTGNSRRK